MPHRFQMFGCLLIVSPSSCGRQIIFSCPRYGCPFTLEIYLEKNVFNSWIFTFVKTITHNFNILYTIHIYSKYNTITIHRQNIRICGVCQQKQCINSKQKRTTLVVTSCPCKWPWSLDGRNWQQQYIHGYNPCW